MPTEEYQYLNLIDNILNNGMKKQDRTGVGTISNFGSMMRFSLRNNKIPLFTTRKIFFRAAVEELLFMLRGDTNTTHLKEKNINIWNGNTSRDFLNKRGLTYLDEGDMGTLYGFQMRHWGAKYLGCNRRYKGEGIDQISKAIELIKNDPTSRRIIVSNYNVSQLETGCLEPCHTFFQFHVDVEKQELNTLLYMRSVDLMCGNPLNCVFYSLMTHLIAKITGLKAGEFVFTSGDTHIYLNHVENAKIQTKREPYEFPSISIKKDIKNLEDIENLTFEDFELINYKYHPSLKFEMAI